MDFQKGFILTRSARDTNGKCELNYYGRSDSDSFKIIINAHRPLFFIRRDSEIPELKGMERRPVELQSFSDTNVDALYFESLNYFYDVRRILKDRQIQMFESDVRPADRYLMERFINGSVEIEGRANTKNGITIWSNPKLIPSSEVPALKWLSIDIETEPIKQFGNNGLLYSIAIHGNYWKDEIKKVLVLKEDYKQVKNKTAPGIEKSVIEYYNNEKDLIKTFLKFVQIYDPDLLIGWHVIGFDLKFLSDKCKALNIPFALGRGTKNTVINERRSGMFSADIEGRVVIDGPQTLRSAFYKFDDFKLETVAMDILGRGKDITPDKDKLAEITWRFNNDKPALARYNLEDCILVSEIYQKTGLIEQLKTRSLITGLPMDKVNMSVAAFDHLMLPAIHRKGRVAYDTDDVIPGGSAAGGHVFTSLPGLYHHVVVLDFKSLYPTIIRTFFIDPLSLNVALHEEKNEYSNIVTTPTGHSFSRSEHILPEFLTEMMEKREHAKKEKNPYLSQAIKILMNSFYGVMGTTGCRFYHPNLPSAITETGQWILKKTAAFLRDKGYQVIYGDTDSVFVCLKEDEFLNPMIAGKLLQKIVNEYFDKAIKDEYKVESKLEMEFEKHYPKFFLPAMRSSKEGARKRYAGYLKDGSIEFKGLEVVRSDWTPLAKKFQFKLFERFFREMDVSEWIKFFIQELKNGKLDNLLAYRKKLTRKAEDYTKITPPQIKAARLEDPDNQKNLKEISYIMTSTGPVPVSMEPTDIDYNHYIEKQIKPLADGVLFAIDLSFDEIIEGRQLDLFS
ncbi:MAG: DNA polymerase II [Spirochaetia bacterium]|jgi:DNA polymerase-2|nr:DNA polymerase II [Spirochaetia bacterium]